MLTGTYAIPPVVKQMRVWQRPVLVSHWSSDGKNQAAASTVVPFITADSDTSTVHVSAAVESSYVPG